MAGSIAVARRSARKQRLLDLLQPLLQLQQAHNLHASLRCATADEEFWVYAIRHIMHSRTHTVMQHC